MTLGEKITTLRNERKLSQTELAEKLEVSRQSVSKWETGASIPELDKLIALSRLFGITLDELVAGDSVPTAEPEEEQPQPQITYVMQQKGLSFRAVLGLILLVVGALALIAGMIVTKSDNDIHPLVLLGIVIAVYGGVCLICGKHPCLACGWLTTGLLSLSLIIYESIGVAGFSGESVPQILFFVMIPIMTGATVLTGRKRKKK